MSQESPLDIAQIEHNFREIAPPLLPAEALFEANRCLYCFDAPCTHACPTHIDVPAFIKKIASGNLSGSARVIFDANPIGATCARVCPVEVLCEGACVEKTLMNKPSEIGRLGIPGEDLEGVYDALYFIERIKSRRWESVPAGRTVAVIGAGNTAVDAVTQARRLGAERVLMVYRRTQAEMPAFDYEYELAKRDEIEFLWQTAPVELIPDGDASRVGALRCVRTRLAEPDASGRRSVEPVEGSEFVVKVDVVIKATGQQKMKELLSS